MSRTRLLAAAAMAAPLALTSGCVGVAVGAAVTGASVVQERSTDQALTDTDIDVRISSKLMNEDAERFELVSVEVVEGRVLMTGVVPAPPDRVRAAEIAWTAPGVVELLNEIEVGDRSGLDDLARDAWISTQLRGRLLAAKGVKEINYNIETINGVVHVIGVAQTEQEMVRVIDIARGTPGVRRVVSHVLTKSDKRRLRS